MQYLFMDNFRGFSNTLIPLRRANFFVGENSTGKSSVLKLIAILSSPQFTFGPDYHIQSAADLGGYDDIASARSIDRSHFSVGGASTDHRPGEPGPRKDFWAYTFDNNEGAARLVRYLVLSGGLITSLVRVGEQWSYKREPLAEESGSRDETFDLPRKLALAPVSTEGTQSLERQAGPGAPLGLVLNILQLKEHEQSLREGKPSIVPSINLDARLLYNVTEIAPIRTKPQRYYDAMKLSFSPEGDHVPLVLRRILSNTQHNARFAERFRAFGKASGLFSAIVPHTFGKNNPQSPFELRVKFSGANFNINNVGYGVSQVFPLIVQFLLPNPNRTFVVQQPEVHLHPRAQSALGDLVFSLTKTAKHTFMIETHSDYLIDRYRLAMSKDSDPPDSQTLFFERTSDGNKVSCLPISENGRYPQNQPRSFREFFIKEEMSLLDI